MKAFQPMVRTLSRPPGPNDKAPEELPHYNIHITRANPICCFVFPRPISHLNANASLALERSPPSPRTVAPGRKASSESDRLSLACLDPGRVRLPRGFCHTDGGMITPRATPLEPCVMRVSLRSGLHLGKAARDTWNKLHGRVPFMTRTLVPIFLAGPNPSTHWLPPPRSLCPGRPVAVNLRLSQPRNPSRTAAREGTRGPPPAVATGAENVVKQCAAVKTTAGGASTTLAFFFRLDVREARRAGGLCTESPALEHLRDKKNEKPACAGRGASRPEGLWINENPNYPHTFCPGRDPSISDDGPKPSLRACRRAVSSMTCDSLNSSSFRATTNRFPGAFAARNQPEWSRKTLTSGVPAFAIWVAVSVSPIISAESPTCDLRGRENRRMRRSWGRATQEAGPARRFDQVGVQRSADAKAPGRSSPRVRMARTAGRVREALSYIKPAAPVRSAATHLGGQSSPFCTAPLVQLSAFDKRETRIPSEAVHRWICLLSSKASLRVAAPLSQTRRQLGLGLVRKHAQIALPGLTSRPGGRRLGVAPALLGNARPEPPRVPASPAPPPSSPCPRKILVRSPHRPLAPRHSFTAPRFFLRREKQWA